MSLKLTCLSDTHGMHSRVLVPPGTDVVVHAGDLTRTGNFLEFIDFLDWFAALPQKHKVCTPGNHDRCVEKRQVDCEVEAKHRGIHLLIDREVTLDGARFYGSPWTPKFCNWYYMKSRGRSIAKVWAKIPEDTHVLVTHGPPYGHGDLAPPYRVSNPRSVGCLELLKRLQDVKPLVHVFGHIHDGYGQTNSDEIGVTTFVNASVCTEEYKPTNPCQIIDLNIRA